MSDPLPFFRDGVQLGLLQCPDYPVYRRGSYDHRYSPAELTPVSNHQSRLVLIIRGNSGELYPDHDITNRLCIITPTTTNWNPTSVFVEVGDRANHQAMFLDKSWCDRVDSGAIVDKGWDRFTINQSLTDIFRSQPLVSGVLIPVGTGSITGGSQFCTGARGALGMWPPFTPVPPFGFNFFFSFSRAFLSSSEFRANLRAGFSGFLQSCHGWPGSPQL